MGTVEQNKKQIFEMKIRESNNLIELLKDNNELLRFEGKLGNEENKQGIRNQIWKNEENIVKLANKIIGGIKDEKC